MKVLMLGGCHTYAYGTDDLSKGYYQRFLEYLNLEGNKVKEISFAPISVRAVNKLISDKIIN